MIVVTGGAGFIGSAVIWGLNRRGRTDILVVDRLGRDGKWRNLAGLRFLDFRHKQSFIEELEHGLYDGRVEAVVHMGACSSTTERDADYLMENNYRYSVRVAEWCTRQSSVRFVYASSAATYGDGGCGYADDERRLVDLRPLNAYGLSKHLFDLHALREGWLARAAGLKLFNVYGPNEAHKGEMRSLIAKAFADVRDGRSMHLFKSHRPECRDGEQRRDFVYVKDAVECVLFLLDRPAVAGIYNVGTGIARTWNDLARAVFSATRREPQIEYVPIPEPLRATYQYHTEADVAKLRSAGYQRSFTTLEDGVRDYVENYLLPHTFLDSAAADVPLSSGTAWAAGRRVPLRP